MVTGVNSGIGFEVMKLLYSRNCHVIGVVRTESKGLDARQECLDTVKGSKGSIEIMPGCDFLDLESVKTVGRKLQAMLEKTPVSIVIHNAGLMASYNNLTSKQGYEAMFQTNVMGPQLLQHYLDPVFLRKDSDLKRIVWVSSGAHLAGPSQYGIFWDDIGLKNMPIKDRPSAMVLYGQSKAANVLQAAAWYHKNEKLANEIGCVSTSCYPGNLASELQRDWNCVMRYIGNRIFYKQINGAYTELYGALSPQITTKDNGAYIVPWGKIVDPRKDVKAGLTNGAADELYELVEEIIKGYF